LAAFTVGAGIIFESAEYSAATHRVAKWLVLGGIAVESLCTVILFVFDEGISREQQSTIEQLVRHRRLSPAQKERIASAVKSFSSTTFVTVTVPDAEPWDFVMDMH
jgi:hypothetical protein